MTKKTKNSLTFLKKNEDFKVFPSSTGEQLLLIFPDSKEAVTLSLIEVSQLLNFALKKQTKLKRAA